MADNKRPEIRFEGFTDAWEQRELNALADRYDTLRVPITATDRVSGSTPYYGANGIQDYVEGYTHDGEFVLVAEDGANDLKNYPVQYVNGKIWANNHTHVLQGKEGIADNRFLKYAISQTKIEPFLVGGGRAKLNAGTMMKMMLSAPLNTHEQEQIGVYFDRYDHLITLHQFEYNKLINIRKSLLEKMFPKDGEDAPEIRFKEYTEAWEQRKLGEVLTERKILQKISDDAPVLAFAAGQGVIDRSERKSNNRDHLTLDPTNKVYLLTEYNDIVYNPSNLKYGAIDRNKHGKGVISPIYVTFITEEEPSFIELIVKSEKFKLRALQFEEGTVVKRQSVKPENLLALDVKISPSKKEQKKIGKLFEHLESLISLHQRELEKLQNVKKASLEKMFV